VKYRVKNGELWVLVEVYIAPCGLVAHWFSHGGVNSYEPVNFHIDPKTL